MGKHSEWRKLAKKARRKRIRQNKAKRRDQLEDEELYRRKNSPSYIFWLEEQTKVEYFQAQEEARLHEERELHWRKVEEEAQRQWQELQKKLIAAKEERARQNEKIKLEWEKEQRRQEELKEQKQREIEEQQRQQEILNNKVNDFLVNGGDTPEHLKTQLETNPNKQICPFFQKTSACRFYDACSRNHVRPGISRIILIPNFFTHYSLDATENEHGSDCSLEFENYETYNYYRDFFYDVIPELETFGAIKLFKTCCNHEPHLRGNVYVEYTTTRAALKSYQALSGRWYGGKQLNVYFCSIESWRTAICGLYFAKRCPKGNACNFLHVFRNPKNIYNTYEDNNSKNSRRKIRNSDEASDRRNWRWSESPERIPIVNEKRSRSRSRDKSSRKQQIHSKKHRNGDSRSHSRTPKRSRSRSRSSSKRSRRSSKT